MCTLDWLSEDSRRVASSSSQHFGSSVWEDSRLSQSVALPIIDTIDDELGFDPFEETNKALAEDIAMEKQLREEEQRQQLQQQQQQQQHQQSFQQIQHRLQQQQQQIHQLNDHQNLRSDLEGFLGCTSTSLSTSRLPPPGFNGISLPTFTSNLQQQQQQIVDVNKLLPSFMSSLNSSLGNVPQSVPPLNGLNRLGGGPPPGLSLLSLPAQLGMGGLDSSLSGGGGGHTNSSLLAALEHSSSHTLSQPPPPPPGLSLPKQEPLVMKDLENGVRNMFSGINVNNSLNTLNVLQSSGNGGPLNFNSFSNMNGLTASLNPLAPIANLNTNSVNTTISFGALNSHHHHQQQQQNSLSALNSLNNFGALNLASAQQQQNSSNNALSNLFGLGQQQLPQQSLLHQLALHNVQKGECTLLFAVCEPLIIFFIAR